VRRAAGERNVRARQPRREQSTDRKRRRCANRDEQHDDALHAFHAPPPATVVELVPLGSLRTACTRYAVTSQFLPEGANVSSTVRAIVAGPSLVFALMFTVKFVAR